MDATAPPANWLEINQRHLTAGIAYIRALLERHIARVQAAETDDAQIRAARDAMDAMEALDTPPAIELLRAHFRLSPFECTLLMLCAAAEFDAGIAPLSA